MSALALVIFVGFLLSILGMGAFAVHRVKLLFLRWRCRPSPVPPPLDSRAPAVAATLPRVCVQLPLYNEPLVVVPLLDHVGALRWPDDRLEIQLLDDSTDDTSARITAWLAAQPAAVAARFRHLRRPHRQGYKAGALAWGMTQTTAPFLAIFDADFRPAPDFLEALLPTLLADDGLGLVQARWDYNNRHANALTWAQGIFLDAHFLIEQPARAAAGLWFNFNGTAGIWRRTALEAAGGWTPDTVTEDLDVSYRAQRLGWRFAYRVDYAVPSELPEHLSPFKSQQHRWTKGGIQVMRKQLGDIWRSPARAALRREATWHLLIGFCHPLLLLFAALIVPFYAVLVFWPGAWGLLVPLALLVTLWATMGQFATAQVLRQGHLAAALPPLVAAPLLLAFGLAMSVTNSMAVLEGLLRQGGEFVRTPKGGQAAARRPAQWGWPKGRSRLLLGAAVEFAFALLLGGGAIYLWSHAQWATAFLLGVKALGFGVVALWSWRECWPTAAAPLPVSTSATPVAAR